MKPGAVADWLKLAEDQGLAGSSTAVGVALCCIFQVLGSFWCDEGMRAWCVSGNRPSDGRKLIRVNDPARLWCWGLDCEKTATCIGI